MAAVAALVQTLWNPFARAMPQELPRAEAQDGVERQPQLQRAGVSPEAKDARPEWVVRRLRASMAHRRDHPAAAACL